MEITRILVGLGLVLTVAVGGIAYEAAVTAKPSVMADTGWDVVTPAPPSR